MFRYSIAVFMAVFPPALAVSPLAVPQAAADNVRLNSVVTAGIYAARYQADCATPDIAVDRALQQAARVQASDAVAHHGIDGDLGSDGSTPQSRAESAGFTGTVHQIVAATPALAINNLQVMQQWYADPQSLAVISDCSNSAIGVWSENSLDRSVVVAVLGRR